MSGENVRHTAYTVPPPVVSGVPALGFTAKTTRWFFWKTGICVPGKTFRLTGAL